MKTIYIGFNTDGYAEQYDSQPQVGYTEMKLPEDHPFFKGNWGAWLRDGNGLKFDEAKHQRLLEEKKKAETPSDAIPQLEKKMDRFQTLIEKLVGTNPARQEAIIDAIIKAVETTAQTVPEKKAMEMPDLYPEWNTGVAYAANTIVKFTQNPAKPPDLYKVMQAHTSQKQWLPKNTPALYKEIAFTADGVPVWVQPQGGHDAYARNVVVMHKAQEWKSDVDGNVWEPGVYGWTLNKK